MTRKQLGQQRLGELVALKQSYMINIFTWNVRGMSTFEKQKTILSLIKMHDASIYCLLETHIKSVNKDGAMRVFEGWKRIANYEFHENGRIWILFKEEKIGMQVTHILAQSIACHVECKSTESKFLCTTVYAFNSLEERMNLWQDMEMLKTAEHWIVYGNFNYVSKTMKNLAKIDPITKRWRILTIVYGK